MNRGRTTGRARRRALWLIAPGVALAGCLDSRATTLAPRSAFGRLSHDLFLTVLWWDVGIFLVVAGVLAVAVWRFREREPGPIPRQTPGDVRLEIAWTVVPALVLAFIAFPTIRGIFATQVAPPRDALRVEVVGHQWWWEFRYPDLGVVTATDLHLPAGRPVALEISSGDVIHSFWVPPLGGKRDALPGGRTRILLTGTVPGAYYGQCAEFCGESHANMRHLAVVVTPPEFEAWVAAQKSPAATPADGSPAAEGLRVYRQGACVGCHRIAGVSAGAIGPDLTHVGSRRTIAGGLLRNTPENLARWLRDSPAVKPGSLMPPQKLSDPEVAALTAYLGSLR